MTDSASTKYFQVDGFGDPAMLTERPTVTTLQENEGTTFFSLELIRGDEIILRRAVLAEFGEEEEVELDWEMVS